MDRVRTKEAEYRTGGHYSQRNFDIVLVFIFHVGFPLSSSFEYMYTWIKLFRTMRLILAKVSFSEKSMCVCVYIY